ncbi:PilC/PilY family type IV pilus protein [Salinimonas chungwhensis]|uniref:PilC/PilY family type IV pilus protein n=1 Tax=Salinimonas chungwhensis TaxID=265425 RepID=UPI000476C7DF
MKNILRWCMSLLLWLCIGASAMADDLDIYLGTADASVTYNPNVLFIMDTSGSMGNRDGTDKSRMLRVKEAFRTAISSATNINAGLMRFSDIGGPVLFPIRDIDSPINPELITSTSGSNSDAHEIDGAVNTTSNVIRLTNGTQTVHSGMRFTQLNIPRGATITHAYLRFTSEQLNTADATMIFRGELSGDSEGFSSSNDITSRPRTMAQVVWDNDNAFPVSNEIFSSPDLTAVIQEIVDQSAWCGGQALSILVEGSSNSAGSARVVNAYDSGVDQSPQLVVEYDETTATGCISASSHYQVNYQSDNREETPWGYNETANVLNMRSDANEHIGVRFRNVNIPQGAEIQEAVLQLTANTSYYYSASTTIRGLAYNNIGRLDKLNRYGLRYADKTSASVNWNMPWVGYGSRFESDNLKHIIEEIVARPGWQPGNALALVMSDFAGVRGAFSYRGSGGNAPKLIVKYKGQATPGTVATVREHLSSKVDELNASGYTPIVDTLYEATNYYGGRSVDYGLQRGDGSVSSNVRRSTRVSHRASYLGADAMRPYGCTEDNLSDSDCIGEYIPAGATYISPVSDLQCQTNNHIVLLSDGEANSNHSVGKIEALLNKSCHGSGGERCGLDLVSNLSDKGESVIDRRIMTHTIGFAANSTANNFLNKLAQQGGGGFYKADDSDELLDAFQTILRSVKDINATFVSPGVAVNQLNRLTHRDELYFALFKPAEGTDWPGNLKKYKLDGNTIVDKNGVSAVDSVSGFFSDTSHSYWSILADGNSVRKGGAASQLSANRNIYMFDGTGNIVTSSNRLHENNSAITVADMGLETANDAEIMRDTVLKWARGVDIKDADGDGDVSDVRLQMGDPIHSQPVIVNYGPEDSAILVATNQGFLHSFDAETGQENFAVIPRELLANLPEFYEDNSTFNHVYGLDGDMVLRSVGNKTYLYVGMRRGGHNYYVFDITQKNNPELVFKIDGDTAGLEKLGQTWSRPTITKVKLGNVTKNVMIVGGGYSEDQDVKQVRSADAVGNAVFIFDADNGALLWQASNTDADLNLPHMQYSIPGRISVIDRDNDGLADHMYVADMGGQLFRLDIYNGQTGADFIKGARLADFGGDTETNNRRFFYGPDISEVALGNEHYYAVAIGSGWRASPLDTVIEDRFYMLKDKGIFKRDENNNHVFKTDTTEATMYNATEHLLTSDDASARELATSMFSNKDGWYLEMTTGGEKILSSPLIIDYKILFTSYIPAESSESACAPPTGNSRAYLVNLANGNAVDDLNQNNQLDNNDRYADLRQSGIAPETKILIEEIIKPVVCLGTECASAVIETEEDGDEVSCTSDFACLVRNIYGRFERVIYDSWTTETERN